MVAVGTLGAIIGLGLYIQSNRPLEGPAPPRLVMCAVLLVLISVIAGAFFALVVAISQASGCGSTFGLFGTENSEHVEACIQHNPSWWLVPLLGLPLAGGAWLTWSLHRSQPGPRTHRDATP